MRVKLKNKINQEKDKKKQKKLQLKEKRPSWIQKLN
jgi:hypothetical protein